MHMVHRVLESNLILSSSILLFCVDAVQVSHRCGVYEIVALSRIYHEQGFMLMLSDASNTLLDTYYTWKG